jgi:glycosyltransferase involved in cell wall biosynthesis
MNKPISLDLAICTYNNAALLDRALDAIAQQQVYSEINWRVLIINNNCTDNTVEIIEKYRQLGKFNLEMVIETIQGLTPARLRGVKEAQGDWVAFIDDDCFLEADWVEQAAQFIAQHPDCGAFGSRIILDWEVSPPQYAVDCAYSYAQQEHGDTPKPLGCLVGAGMVIRKQAIIDCGWCDRTFLADRVGKKLVSGGDVEMALRLAATSELWYNPACRLHHHIPEYRLSLPYLYKINFGLGSCKLFGDSMLWPKSYPSWFIASCRDGIRDSIKALKYIFYTLKDRKPVTNAIVFSIFTCGWWMGIWRMLWMNPQQRQALVGCAVPQTSISAPIS